MVLITSPIWFEPIRTTFISTTTTTSTPTNNTVQALISSYEIYREAAGVYRWRYWNSVGEIIAESSLTYESPRSCDQDIHWIKKSEAATIILGASRPGGVYSYMIYKDIVNYQLVFRWWFNDSLGRDILRSFQIRKTESDCYKDIYVLQKSYGAAVINR